MQRLQVTILATRIGHYVGVHSDKQTPFPVRFANISPDVRVLVSRIQYLDHKYWWSVLDKVHSCVSAKVWNISA